MVSIGMTGRRSSARSSSTQRQPRGAGANGRIPSRQHVAAWGEDGALDAIQQVAELIDRVALRIEAAITPLSRQEGDDGP
jgi:hypothetical protein